MSSPIWPGTPPAPADTARVLREYALLADGERGALIGPRGDVAWMCMPRWDSAAVFSALIGGGGSYLVAPNTQRFVWGGFYEEGSLIWGSRWVTTTGTIECREALAWPGDTRKAVLLRRVIARRGPARVRVVLDPRADFGRSPMRDLHRREAQWTCRCGPLYLRWNGPEHARERDGRVECVLEVPAGGQHDLLLELSTAPLHEDPTRAGTGLGGHRGRLAARGAAAGWRGRSSGLPPRLHGAARSDQLERRHGGRGDHVTAGTGRQRA